LGRKEGKGRDEMRKEKRRGGEKEKGGRRKGEVKGEGLAPWQ
jgi:hypothetical protein